MFHRRKHILFVTLFPTRLFGRVQYSLITSSQPITTEPLTNNTQSNQTNKKKKELFRYLFVFLTIYFKCFEGEFWWAKGLRVREERYARASRRVTIESNEFNSKFDKKKRKNVNCITNSKIAILITFFFVKFGVEFITSGSLSLLSCLPEHDIPL